ncbi:hypothetical protein M9Y10_020939 [Tritrichomonas musculus]|uniref:Saposin B-type domain-containing protein n=1 Tax=Tritrichomonas musculus TaxID=1915356 RepID=A0ABR2HF11_9EUKA
MISIFLIFTLIHSGTCLRRIPRRKKNQNLNDEFTTACDLCLTLNSALIRYNNYGYSDDQIQANLLNVCSDFPDKGLEVCNYISDTYFPVFLYLAKNGVPASSSCTKMGYCSDLE